MQLCIRHKTIAAVFDCERYVYIRIENKINWEMLPLIYFLPELCFYLAPYAVAYGVGKRAVGIQLVPWYLIYHYHRPYHFTAI